MNKKRFVYILVIALLSYGIYFFLDFRRTNYINDHVTNSYLLFDNPSSLNLKVYLNEDTIDVPSWSVVHFPVNDLLICASPVRIRAIDSKSGKIIVDSTRKLPPDIFEYFINPALQDYLRLSQMKMVLSVYEVDKQLNPIGGRKTIVQDMGGADSTLVKSLIVDTKGLNGPFNQKTEKKNTTSHSEVQIHLLRYISDTSYKDISHIFYSQEWEGFLSPKRILKQSGS